MQKSNWSFYAQILTRALNELEAACSASPESKEFDFYREEAPMVLEEARDALSVLTQHMQALERAEPSPPPDATRH